MAIRRTVCSVQSTNITFYCLYFSSTVGSDLRIIFAELFEQKGIAPRGLAHPIAFTGTQLNEIGGRTPGILRSRRGANSEIYEFGAIPVTPKNYYRLMQSGQAGLLFPGGAKETLTGRKDYPLFWPTRTAVAYTPPNVLTKKRD